ncbi:MAG: hypothetical protein KJ950_01045 [Proteobacteria bacterium]|nr:hypothetical protein [Pseudomonadota bacterium]MBU1686243.1 hypothetical protein [Pseudomonadota bacterium]
MKRVFKSLALAGTMLAFAATAQAADTAQVTLTSPAIIKKSCEQVGSITMTFDAGTILTEGDWLYMDLPTNTYVCSPGIDYMIGSARAIGNEAFNITYPATSTAAGLAAFPLAAAAGTTIANANAFLTGMGAFPGLAINATAGPYTNNTVSNVGAATVAANVVFHVSAPANGRRVWVKVYGTTDAATLTDTLTVAADSSLTMRLLDGKPYNGFVVLNNTGTNTALVAGVATVWGDVTTDEIALNDGVAYPAPHNIPNAENTLCVNAENMSGDLMFTSFNSLNSFLTFTGDSQLAHTASNNAISLISCSGKTAKPATGNLLIGDQGKCSFDYEDTMAAVPVAPTGYCTTNSANPFTGNRMLVNAASPFGDPGDRYDMTVTASSGVYFSGTGVALTGYTPSQTQDTGCIAGGTAVPAAFAITGSTTGFDAGSCAVSTSKRVSSLSTGRVGAITGIDTYDTLFVDFPLMVYDTSIIGNGVEAVFTIALDKYPCGNIFTESRTVGTFVTTCPAIAAGTGTILLYPFLPPMDGSIAGWWGGFTVVNGSAAAGTCTLAFTDGDGDTASYTTPSIAAAGQWNAGALATLLSNLTAGTGNVGDANVAVVATCTFGLGGGFAFTGNGDEGTGYTAYVQSAGAWQ